MDLKKKTPQSEAKVLQKYVANSDCWVAGCRKKKGDVVELTKGQAKYEDVTLKSTGKSDADEKPVAPSKGKAS